MVVGGGGGKSVNFESKLHHKLGCIIVSYGWVLNEVQIRGTYNAREQVPPMLQLAEHDKHTVKEKAS
jgi:hypothetical protein